MTLALVLVLVALAQLLARLRWRRVSFTVYLAAALAFALTGYGLTANFLLKKGEPGVEKEIELLHPALKPARRKKMPKFMEHYQYRER